MTKTQLTQVLNKSIEIQSMLLKRIKREVGSDANHTARQFDFQKSLYKTAFSMMNKSGCVVDGVKVLGESEVFDFWDHSFGGGKEKLIESLKKSLT